MRGALRRWAQALVVAGALLVGPAASGQDSELLLEQARSALTLERSADARRLSQQALSSGASDLEAYRTYARSSRQAGLGPLAQAELRALGTPTARVALEWARTIDEDVDLAALRALAAEHPEARVALASALVRGAWREDDVEPAQLQQAFELLAGTEDPDGARLALRLLRWQGRGGVALDQARSWLARHPDRPDVLEVLWPGEADRDLSRARRIAVREVLKELPRRQDDPTWLYRALQVLAVAGTDPAYTSRVPDRAEGIAARLEAMGLQPGLARHRWNPRMRRAMGRTLALSSTPEMPMGTRAEVYDIAIALETRALSQGRRQAAMLAWEQVQAQHPGLVATLALARLLVEEERWDEALVQADRAVSEAAAPAWDDLARLDPTRQAEELATALGLQAEALLELSRAEEAVVSAWLARQLDPHPQWDALWMRGMASLGPSALEHDPVAWRIALDKAEEALDRDAPSEAVAIATRVLQEVARLDRDGAGGERAHGLRALSIRAKARSLPDAVALTLLVPDHPAAWLLRARRHEAAGHTDAAFAAFAVAQSLGAGTEEELARTYRGPADPETATVAMLAIRASAGTERTHALHVVEEAPPGPAPPTVGKAMPPWEARTLAGERVGRDALAGKTYVLALWASWCGPCLLELPEVSRTVGALRAEGLDVEAVAISVDDQEVAARRAVARHRWADILVGWTGDRSGVFAVTNLPTTWVVARDGTVVSAQVGYDTAFAKRLERLLRAQAE